MEPFGSLSLLPPVAAIVLAIVTRQVYLSLLTGVWLGWTMMSGWNPVAGFVAAVDALVAMLADGERTRIVFLTLMIGGLIALAQASGGMRGFVEWVVGRGLVSTRRAAGLLAWSLGFFIVVESLVGVLVSGVVSRPLFDRLRMSREKLAYLLDSTCAPKATLVLVNSWGAYLIGLLAAQDVEAPVRVLVLATSMNFYAILAIAMALAVAVLQIDLGPMREAERRVRDEGKLLRDGAAPLVASETLLMEPRPGVPPRAANLVVPVVCFVVTVPLVLVATGGGNPMNGSGTLAAFWGAVVGLLAGMMLCVVQGHMKIGEITDSVMQGIGSLVPVGVVLLLAFGIGDVCRLLGTGPYVARAAQAGLSPSVMPAMLFAVACVTSFATGTSFGTWAIMIPIAVPMADLLGLPLGLTLGAVVGGGLFGDHSSPISDSTIVSSMAAGTDHMDHVRTQFPYAAIAAGASVVLYLVLGTIARA